MKKTTLILALYLIVVSAVAQNSIVNTQQAFLRGEKLTFKLYYNSSITGNVQAGELVSEVKPNKVFIANRSSYHVVLDGKTKGAFNWFFKVRDRFESYIDEERLLPHFFKKKTREGDYETERDVRFNIESGKIDYHNKKNGNKGTLNTSLEVQDLVSSLYYIRNWKFDKALVGDRYYLNLFLDDSIHQIQFEYMGLSNVETKLGEIECIKFKPYVITGGVFADESPMTVYVSNDQNHLPILVVSEVMIGSVRMELMDYDGIRHSLNIKK